jgi:hypothetical protein
MDTGWSGIKNETIYNVRDDVFIQVIRNRSIFIAGVALCAFASCLLLVFLFSQPFYPAKTQFIAVSSNASSDTAYFIGIYPYADEDVTIVISEWNETKTPSYFFTVLSEEPLHPYLLLNSRLASPASADGTAPPPQSSVRFDPFISKYFEKIDRPEYMVKVPFPENASYARIVQSGSNGGYLIYVDPSQIRDYYGTGFSLKGGIKKISAYEKEIALPILLLKMGEDQPVHDVRTFIVQAYNPPHYELSRSIPEPDRFLLREGGNAMYQYTVNDPEKTNILMIFEDRTLNNQLNYLTIILSTLLGIGVAMAIDSIIGSRKRNG